MTSAPRLVRPILSVLGLLTLACGLSACVTPTPPPTVAFDCSRRIPPKLRDDVPGVSLDTLDGTQGGDAVALDQQTGRLDQANDEKGTVLWIVDQCEAEKTGAVTKATRRWFEFWKH